MKRLSDFKGDAGIVMAANVLSVIMEMLVDQRNAAQSTEKNPLKMFATFMANSPDKMRKIFALLSEQDVAAYECDGAEAMMNMLILANDPLIVSLFISQSRKWDAKSSGSASVNTEE